MPGPSPDRDAIMAELLAGATPYQVSKRYPRATVYRVYNELQDGKASGSSGVAETPPVIPLSENQPRTTVRTTRATSMSGLSGVSVVEVPETVLPGGSKHLPTDALNAVRGILGMITRPKVLSMPTPELLYPSMVISIEEWGWPPMRPNDFIDAVLDRFLRAADIEYNTYIKRGTLEEILKYAAKGGYKPPGNGGAANTVGVKEETSNDSTTGTTRPTGEENRSGDKLGSNSQDQTGRGTGGEGGDSGPPI